MRTLRRSAADIGLKSPFQIYDNFKNTLTSMFSNNEIMKFSMDGGIDMSYEWNIWLKTPCSEWKQS